MLHKEQNSYHGYGSYHIVYASLVKYTYIPVKIKVLCLITNLLMLLIHRILVHKAIAAVFFLLFLFVGYERCTLKSRHKRN